MESDELNPNNLDQLEKYIVSKIVPDCFCKLPRDTANAQKAKNLSNISCEYNYKPIEILSICRSPVIHHDWIVWNEVTKKLLKMGLSEALSLSATLPESIHAMDGLNTIHCAKGAASNR